MVRTVVTAATRSVRQKACAAILLSRSPAKFSSVRPSVSIDRNASIRRCSEGRMASRAMMTTAGAERIHPMPAGAVPLLGVTAQHHEPVGRQDETHHPPHYPVRLDHAGDGQNAV